MQVNIQIDKSSLSQIESKIKDYPAQSKNAIVAVLNRALTSANTQMKRSVTQKYKISQSNLTGYSKLIKLSKATYSNLDANIAVEGRNLTLYRFATGTKIPKTRAGKTMKQIKRLSTPKVQVIKGKSSNMQKSIHPFIARAKGTLATGGENYQIYARNADGTIRVLRTLSTAHMVNNSVVLSDIQKTVSDTVDKRVLVELDRYL